MRESIDHLAMLKSELALIAGDRPMPVEKIATGHAEVDQALGGGLTPARLHELFAAEGEDSACASSFALMLALRAAGRKAPILWFRTDEATRRLGTLHAPGVVELGGNPDSLLLCLAPDTRTLLRSASDAARCSGLGALIVECWGKCPMLDLTSSRRFTLAAEQSGVTLFLLRLEAEPLPSAADTRWAVRAEPTQPLEMNAPGHPRFDIELLRRRSGPAGMRWCLEWNRDRLLFNKPALPGALVPLPSRRPASEPLRRSA